ncbi:drug:h+ antiporter [Phellopilus nigrolimitatus]|nr:drug:h+ antiporter [Phellopilus nigrolimitatus]
MSADLDKKDADSERALAVEALPVLDARTQHALAREADAHAGVARVEAAEKVYGRRARWILFVSLGLASYIYALDGSTTSNYLSFAASSFGEHSLISSVTVAQSVIIAVGKPVIAKVADVTSRAYAYLGVLIFYVLGYIVIASAQSIGAIAGGIVIYAVGYTGLQLLTQIIIADLTTLKWRGLVSSLTSMPFVVNGFIGPNIATAVLAHAGWRWGYGMFAILVPATLLPLIITLFWAERKARRIGLIDAALVHDGAGSTVPVPGKTFIAGLHRAAGQLDLIGLVLLGAAVALILLPLTLAEKAKDGWKNPSMIAMLVVGGVLLVLFAGWDLRAASRPVVAPRFVRNRSVVITSIIGFFDFMSFYLTYVYLYSFVLVVKPWSILDATYFMQAQTIALTVFGFAAGVGMWYSRRYKNILVAGLAIRLLGVGLMVHSRGANASTTEIVWTQILQGLGGGMAAASMQVGAQASVPHVDVAMVTAVVLLVTEIGGAVGGAIAGAIWTNMMPGRLAAALPGLSADERAALFGSITDVLAYPRGDPIREGVISAYDGTMKVMVVAATALSVVPLLLALGLPDWYLGDTQNAVDAAALDGELRRPDGPAGPRD